MDAINLARSQILKATLCAICICIGWSQWRTAAWSDIIPTQQQCDDLKQKAGGGQLTDEEFQTYVICLNRKPQNQPGLIPTPALNSVAPDPLQMKSIWNDAAEQPQLETQN